MTNDLKKLPSLFKINHNIKSHNTNYCYLKEKGNEYPKKDINLILENLFSNPNLYQIPVIIKTKNNKIVTRLLKKEKNKVITIKQQEIMIEDIIDIEK